MMGILQHRYPLVIAHTGCEGTRDNSEASLDAAILSGADMLEVDIRTTRDGYPVLAHDPEIPGAVSPPLIIAESTHHEVQDHLQQDPQRVAEPRAAWETVLRRMASWSGLLNLDLKDEGSIERIWRDVQRHNLAERVIFTGCNGPRARRVRAVAPTAPVLLNITADDVPPRNRGDAELFEQGIRDLCATALASGCAGINIDYRWCTPYVVDHAHRRFLSVTVWTVDRQDEMERLLTTGVDAITTRRPAHLAELLQAERSAG